MLFEWLLLALLFGGAWLTFGDKQNARLMRLTALFLISGAVAAGAWWQNHLERKLNSLAQLTVPHQQRPGGYVSSDNCCSCHPDQYASWHRSFHRTMTQVASPTSVRGDFNHVTLQLDGQTYQLERRNDEFWVDAIDPDWKFERAAEQAEFEAGRGPRPATNAVPQRSEKRICLLTGSHHMQAYWLPGKHGNQEYSFPFTYLFEEERWVPRDAVFLKDPRAPRLEQVWNANCIRCHATAGQPRQNSQSGILDTRVGELGIACEACHGPAEEHVRLNSDPRRRYALHGEKKSDSTIVNPARLTSKRSSEVCGQCHGVIFMTDAADWRENGFRYRPGDDLDARAPVIRYAHIAGEQRFPEQMRTNLHLFDGFFWSDGMIRVSGREHNGLLETACYQKGEMSCLSCHSMHQSSPTNQLGAGMESNQACVQCHKKFEKNVSAHTHHATNSEGSLCYNCHMPYTTYGLMKGLRSHQVASPSVKTTVQTGRPDACNLCHLDKTLAWTSAHLQTWYGIPQEKLPADADGIAASVLWILKGEAGQRALIAWHMGWPPARHASGDQWFAPYLAQLLEDPYPAVRYIAGRSLRRLPGFEKFSYDFVAGLEDRRRAKQSSYEIWAMQKMRPAPELLLDWQGRIDAAKFEALRNQRNNRSMELLE
jgi:predicted CXXCH cytochrome family protein